MSSSLTFVTGNANKLKEVQSILGSSIPNLQSAKIDRNENTIINKYTDNI
jgi:inosine/xanthosine triphosphate pyrophosphatase family protein